MGDNLETILSCASTLNDDCPVTFRDLQEAFHTLNSDKDLVLESIIEGFHPDLDELVALLSDYSSSEGEDSEHEDLSKTSGHGARDQSMSERQSIDCKRDTANKSCLAAKSRNKQLLDFDTNDECNKIIYQVPDNIRLSSRSTRKEDIKKKRKLLLGDLIVRVPLGLPQEYAGMFEKRKKKTSTGKKDGQEGNNSSKRIKQRTNKTISKDDKDAHMEDVTSENGRMFEKMNGNNLSSSEVVHTGGDNSENDGNFKWVNGNITSGNKYVQIGDKTLQNMETIENTSGNMSGSRDINRHVGDETSQNAGTSNKRNDNVSPHSDKDEYHGEYSETSQNAGTSNKRNDNVSPHSDKDGHVGGETSQNAGTSNKRNDNVSPHSDKDEHHGEYSDTSQNAGTSNKRNDNVSHSDKDEYHGEYSIAVLKSSQDSDETLDPSAVENIEPETETPEIMVDRRPSSQSKVEQLVNESKQTLKNLVENSVRFKKTIKDPYDGSNQKGDVSDDDENKGNEPLEKRKKFLAAQKSAEQLGWSSSDEDVKISEIQASNRHQRKTLRKKRSIWTREEMDWLREGVRLYGVGDWATIRDHFPFPSSHKNSVAIKDKYRNMKRNGQIF